MSGVKLDERGLMVLCSLNSSKLLKSLFQIVLVLHDVPARAFLYKVFGKVVDFIVLLHQRFYSLPSRVDFLESRHARCLDWFSGLSLALSNLCDLLLCCLRNFAFSELGIVSQLGNCVVKVSNRFLEIVFPCSAHYSIRYDVYFLVVRCFVEQINVMVFYDPSRCKDDQSLINPLTPKSDQHLISPYNITPDLHIKVTRIQEMITN